VMAKPIARYRRRALQFDGANAADVIAFVGGGDYAKVVGEDVIRVLIPKRGGPFNVVSDGEFNIVFEEDTGGPGEVEPL